MKLFRVLIYGIIIYFIIVYGKNILISKNIGFIDFSNPEKYKSKELDGFIEMKVIAKSPGGFNGICMGNKLFIIGNTDNIKPGDIIELSGNLIKPYVIKYNYLIIYRNWKRNAVVIISLLTLLAVIITTCLKYKSFI